MPDNFTRSEETTYRELVVSRLDDLKSDMCEVKLQTTKTSGRVSKLENWKYMLAGAWAVLAVMIIPIMSAFIVAGKL